jgi:pantetheine-phosphate adenylyltransferase
MKKGKTVAIVPGSFDPITYGHIDIAKRASELYDFVYVAVMINDQKKYMFSIDERKRIANEALCKIDGVSVISSEGMLWELARDLCADAIVKGYRNDVDLEYEKRMAEYNAQHYPSAKTVLLKADEWLDTLSSTIVRERIIQGMSLEGFLPQEAVEIVNKILLSRDN